MVTTERRLKAIREKQTKAQIIASISEETLLDKKQVRAVLESLANHAKRHLMSRGSGQFIIPELSVKLRRVSKPATKSRKGRNPLTGEEIMIKAKPARQVIKVSALKSLKDAL